VTSQSDIGVLLVNLGTPDAPTPRALRRYLREFLSDPRVVEVPRPIWWFVLRAFVLPFRPRKSAEAYAAIWDRERDASPLRLSTQDLAEALGARFEKCGVRIGWAMRYGEPSLQSRIDEMMRRGVRRLLVWPLYPQYSASTTGSVVDGVGQALASLRNQPTLRFVPPYYQDELYVAGVARAVTTHLATLTWKPQLLLASFHGIPVAYAEAGDPYPEQCHRTANALRETLGLPEDQFRLTFQSRFGPSQWLTPYTDVTLAALPDTGVRRVAVVAPGFAADCVETLEELGLRGRDAFLGAGGEQFALLPCLNAGEEAVALGEALIQRELSGWLVSS
jgi:ferrochelatase